MARDGIADVTYVSPGYQPGRFRSSMPANLPFMVTNAQEGSGALDEWYQQICRQGDAGRQILLLAFFHDPGSFHSKAKKIVVPGDIKGMKIRPRHATMASWVTQLGGTNVQSSAPEVRDNPRERRRRSRHIPVGFGGGVRHRQGDEISHGRAAITRRASSG